MFLRDRIFEGVRRVALFPWRVLRVVIVIAWIPGMILVEAFARSSLHVEIAEARLRERFE
jgi:hypothetical protein